MLILKQLAKDYNVTQNELAKILCTDQSQVSKMMNGLREIKGEHISLLEAYFGKEVIARYDVTEEQFDAWRSRFARPFTGQILSADIVEEIEEKAAEEAKAELLETESIPILPADVANKPCINIREYIQKNEDELERINPSKILQPADLAEKILGMSMYPDFIPGDIVFPQYIGDVAKIIDGNTYYFDLKSRPTMIRKVKIEGDKLRLIALHPEYGDIITTRDDIFNVGRIVGLLRTTFGSHYADIEALRERKDKQIEILIAQNHEALRSISDLVAVIKDKH